MATDVSYDPKKQIKRKLTHTEQQFLPPIRQSNEEDKKKPSSFSISNTFYLPYF